MAARQSKGKGRGAAAAAADVPREGDFVEALARGLEVLKCFGTTAMELTVSDVAARTELARPTARRLLLTLEQLGYVRSADGVFSLTTRVLELGTATDRKSTRLNSSHT